MSLSNLSATQLQSLVQHYGLQLDPPDAYQQQYGHLGQDQYAEILSSIDFGGDSAQGMRPGFADPSQPQQMVNAAMTGDANTPLQPSQAIGGSPANWADPLAAANNYSANNPNQTPNSANQGQIQAWNSILGQRYSPDGDAPAAPRMQQGGSPANWADPLAAANNYSANNPNQTPRQANQGQIQAWNTILGQSYGPDRAGPREGALASASAQQVPQVDPHNPKDYRTWTGGDYPPDLKLRAEELAKQGLSPLHDPEIAYFRASIPDSAYVRTESGGGSSDSGSSSTFQ